MARTFPIASMATSPWRCGSRSKTSSGWPAISSGQGPWPGLCARDAGSRSPACRKVFTKPVWHPRFRIRLRQSFFRGSDSGFAEIAYLPAGHSLRFSVEDQAPQIHRAYRPDESAVGKWTGTRDAAARKLKTLLAEAVRRRMPTDKPVACHLSGGLDSSAITALAAKAARGRGAGVIALSMTTLKPIGPAQLDERPLIEALLKQYP